MKLFFVTFLLALAALCFADGHWCASRVASLAAIVRLMVPKAHQENP